MPEEMELKWTNGPKREKAKQIPHDVWNQYESEIRGMHASMTLEELVAEMKRIHGFEATLRQYTARLERWGLKRYKIKNTAFKSMAEGSRENMELAKISTAITGSSKRARITPSIDDHDTASTEGSALETPSSKKPKMADEQGEIHKPQVSTLAENRSATMGSNDGVFTCTTPDLPADLLHDPQGSVLCEAILRSILDQSNFVDQYSVQNISVEWCLRIANSIKSFQLPHRGPELSTETENDLKVIADYLFAMESFAEATHIYSIVSGSERSRQTGATLSYTRSLISAARAARSKEECTSIKKTLEEFVHEHRCDEWSQYEQFIAHTLLAILASRLEQVPETSDRFSSARHLASKFRRNKNLTKKDLSFVLLGYVYDALLHNLPSFVLAPDRVKPQAARRNLSISRADLLQFPPIYYDPTSEKRHLMGYLEESLHWCRMARAWFVSSGNFIKDASDVRETFASLWKMWHGGYAQCPRSPGWTKGPSGGVSLAEHLKIFARVIHILEEELHESNSVDCAITFYLEILYEGINVSYQLRWDNTKDRPISRGAPMITSMSSRMTRPRTRRELSSNFVPTIAPSIGSTDSSFGRLKEASTAIAFRRWREGSYKSDTTPGIEYVPSGSNPSISFLSEVFARSCSVSVSNTPQEPSVRKSLSLHTETSFKEFDEWASEYKLYPHKS